MSKISKLSGVILSLLMVALIFAVMEKSQDTKLFVAFAETPDSYDNEIIWLCVYQHNGTHYVLLGNFSGTGWTQQVAANYAINMTVRIALNNTLASGESQAIDYTRVYMNITQTTEGDIWSNEILNNTASSSDADFYYMTEEAHWNQTGYPAESVTYNVTARYEAYYSP